MEKPYQETFLRACSLIRSAAGEGVTITPLFMEHEGELQETELERQLLSLVSPKHTIVVVDPFNTYQIACEREPVGSKDEAKAGHHLPTAVMGRWGDGSVATILQENTQHGDFYDGTERASAIDAFCQKYGFHRSLAFDLRNTVLGEKMFLEGQRYSDLFDAMIIEVEDDEEHDEGPTGSPGPTIRQPLTQVLVS